MKYQVTINEQSKSITVNLDGYIGVAKCCPTDSFNITTGIELALERAKVAKKNAEAKMAVKATPPKQMGVMELVKALEKALPKGQMVVVGNGDRLTEANKRQLLSLSGHKCPPSRCRCDGERYTEDEIEDIKADAYDEGYDEGYSDGEAHKEAEIAEAYDEGHADGYDAGYADAMDEVEENTLTEDEVEELTDTIRNIIEEALGV